MQTLFSRFFIQLKNLTQEFVGEVVLLVLNGPVDDGVVDDGEVVVHKIHVHTRVFSS